MIESLVEQIESRFAELSRQMTDPEVIGDRNRFAEVGREYRRLEPAAKLAEEWRRTTDDVAGAQELIAEDGDDAGLWAGDLFRMLSRYAERRGFRVEPLDVGDGKYTFEVKGDGAYSVFKYEGGTHRVQRVPATESQGRIHTSTATVAVL